VVILHQAKGVWPEAMLTWQFIFSPFLENQTEIKNGTLEGFESSFS